MAKRTSVAQAKAQFSALLAEVAHQAQRYIIERRGKPVAALVTIEDLDLLEAAEPTAPRPQGALALIGGWGDVDDDAIEALVADIYAQRKRDAGRVVKLEP